MYDPCHKFFHDEYRKETIKNPNVGIREFANKIGMDFWIVWEVLGFKDWFDFYDTGPDDEEDP